MQQTKNADGTFDFTNVDPEVAFWMAYCMKYYARNGAESNAYSFKRAIEIVNEKIETGEVPDEYFKSSTTVSEAL
jgi:uncharacterized membrane protein